MSVPADTQFDRAPHSDGYSRRCCRMRNYRASPLATGCEKITCVQTSTWLTYNHMVVDELSDHDVDRIFRALADRTRRDIFERVLITGLSVSTLADDYEMSFAAVQKHVGVLERASLVTKERRGREQIVHGNVPVLRRASALLDMFEQIWMQRDRQIAEILDEKGKD